MFFFGAVIGERVDLNPTGEVIRDVWNSLPERFPRVVLDRFVIMPNHLHGVLGFVGAGFAPPAFNPGMAMMGRAIPVAITDVPAVKNHSLANVIGAFKSISTIRVNKLLGRKGLTLWQRSYHEHIVRRGEDLRKIQQYILENPLMWALDQENPDHKSG